MSTKTSIKRIALVAVSALGFGLLSVMPAQAIAGACDTATATLGTKNRTSISEWQVIATITCNDAAVPAFAAGDTIAVTAVIAPDNAGTLDTVTVEEAEDIDANGDYTLTAADVTAESATFTALLTISDANVLATNAAIDGLVDDYEITITAGTATDATADAFDIAASAVEAIDFLTPTAFSVTSDRIASQVVNGDITFVATGGTAVTRYTVTTSGVGSMVSAVVDSANHTVTQVGTALSGGFSWNTPIGIAGASDAGTLTLTVTSATAGVQTITVRPVGANGLPGTAVTLTATYSAASTTLASTTITKVTGTSNATGTTYYGSNSATAAAAIASFEIEQLNSAGAALSPIGLTAAVVIQLTGVGSLSSVAGGGGAVTSVQAYSAGLFPNSTTFGVWGSGTSGNGTVTVSVAGSQIWSKTFYFYGTPATIEATANYTIVRAGGYEAGELDDVAGVPTADNDPAIAVAVKDSAGQRVPVVPTLASSNTAVILSGATDSFSDTGTGTYSAGFGMAHYTYSSTASSTSGQTSDLTFTYQLSNGTVLTSNVVKVTTGGTRTGGTVTATLDKTSYAPGEKMVLTFNAKDASGNPVYDGITQAAPVANKSVTGLAAATGAYIDGEFVFGDDSGENLYAPAVSGPFELVVSTGTATGATITVTATVGDDGATAAANAASDAAAEAIDAANAATDAANLAAEAADAATVAAEEARDAADAATAAVEALATEVATLMAALKAQITTLANTVAKIAKKVKA